MMHTLMPACVTLSLSSYSWLLIAMVVVFGKTTAVVVEDYRTMTSPVALLLHSPMIISNGLIISVRITFRLIQVMLMTILHLDLNRGFLVQFVVLLVGTIDFPKLVVLPRSLRHVVTIIDPRINHEYIAQKKARPAVSHNVACT